MSLDENMEMARKALNEGACFFLQKPIRRRDIANVWQHVFRKRTSSQKIENCKAFIEEKEVPNKDSCREKIIKVDGLCKIVAINDFQGREKGRLTTNKGIEDDEQKEDDPMKTDEMSILQDIFKEQIVNIEKGKQRESNIIQGINTMKKDSRGGKIEEVGRLPRVSIGSGLLGISNENLPTNRRGKRIEIDREPGLEWRNRAKELSRITQIASMEMGNQGLSSRKRGNNDNDGRSRERRDLERSNYSKGLRSFENGSERKYTDNSSREKRLRMKWTPALHIKFMEAISALGDRKAHPKSVLRIMNEPNLTVRHVASHLQQRSLETQHQQHSKSTSEPDGSEPTDLHHVALTEGIPGRQQSHQGQKAHQQKPPKKHPSSRRDTRSTPDRASNRTTKTRQEKGSPNRTEQGQGNPTGPPKPAGSHHPLPKCYHHGAKTDINSIPKHPSSRSKPSQRVAEAKTHKGNKNHEQISTQHPNAIPPT
ncbi:hypothetical protein U1Q18_043825 [Sarracenia purpurea var. burkii]